jgi:hypothetical protein
MTVRSPRVSASGSNLQRDASGKKRNKFAANEDTRHVKGMWIAESVIGSGDGEPSAHLSENSNVEL